MPIARVQLPDGRIARFEVPEGTTPDQVQSFAESNLQTTQRQPAPVQQPVAEPADPTTLQNIGGAGEVALTIGSGAIAEPLAGLAGIAQGINPFAQPGAAARAVEATRGALTFQPRTEAGREQLEAVGGALAPIGEAITGTEEFLGDKMFEATKSPALAAAAASLPTAILETIGLKGGGKIAKSTKDIQPSEKAIRRSLKEASPQPEVLKTLSRDIYKELDGSGVSLKRGSYTNLVIDLRKAAKKQGLSKRTTPKSAGLLQEFEDVLGSSPSLSEIDDLRTVAQGVSKSLERTEAAIGSRIVNEIDDFLDTLNPKQINRGSIDASEVGGKYRAARNLWGRARKSEVIQETIERAKNRASGFENGLRVEFDKIVKNKKINRFFTNSEIDAINDLVRGDVKQNFAKLIGRFGFGEGRATNIIGGVMGSFAGTATGGLPGFVGAVAVGASARKIAQKLTKNKAEFIGAMTRAGNDGEQITKAYLRLVPKSKRSVVELSELLSDPNVDVAALAVSSNKLIKEAAEIAAGRQVIGEAIGLSAVGAAQNARLEE